MPEWLLAAIAAAVISAGANAIVAAWMLGRTAQVVTRLDIDVKDMQRDKLDTSLHDSHAKRIEDRINYVDEKHTEGRRVLDHKVSGVQQAVKLLEDRR